MHNIKLNIFFALAILMIARDAYAYIDPGSGSYAIQMIIAALLGGAFTIKTFFKKFFSRKTNKFASITDDVLKNETESSLSNGRSGTSRSPLKKKTCPTK